jgi:S-adenosylmethionine synthetase
MVMVFGEITTNAEVNYEKVVRDTCKEVGYDSVDKGLDYKTFAFLNFLSAQSSEISNAVTKTAVEEIGAGD